MRQSTLSTISDQITPSEDSILDLLHRIPNKDLKHAIQDEIGKFMSDCDQIIRMLQRHETILNEEHKSLKFKHEQFHQRYEKAMREMKFFKHQYSLCKQGRPLTVFIDPHVKTLQSLMHTINETDSTNYPYHQSIMGKSDMKHSPTS